ncbi:17988_t:CDS:1 [Cetraspora pellucida]|uniref:17988_t:CDS:1 n=1 Tax=Cetraspora pellucida TaxID=1433469 RepID=A0ACA9JYQ0_9GLOM|nr:17988_t:CDS:1 [Cetraspora pellucida]
MTTTRTDISQIADEFRSTNSQMPNKQRRLTPARTTHATSSTSNILSNESILINSERTINRKGKKKLTDLALDSLGLNNDDREEEVEEINKELNENSEQEDNQDQLEISEQEKKQKKRKCRRINKGSMSMKK